MKKASLPPEDVELFSQNLVDNASGNTNSATDPFILSDYWPQIQSKGYQSTTEGDYEIDYCGQQLRTTEELEVVFAALVAVSMIANGRSLSSSSMCGDVEPPASSGNVDDSEQQPIFVTREEIGF